MMRRRVVSFALAVIASTPFVSTLQAQTLFATRGLGAPIAPTDARADALGGIGTGLSGISMSLTNPADVAGLLRRGGTATLSPTWNSVDLGGASDRIGGSRFPLMRVFYPVNPKLAASLSYGAYLDQTWGVQFSGKEVLGTDTIGTSDVVSSTGGIAQLRFGFSYMLSDRLAIGVGGGMLTGSLDRAVQRTFTDSAFEPFESRLTWAYKAPQATFGVRFDPLAGTRIAASLAIGGKLKANAQDSIAEDREYGSSMRVNVGASTMITPILMATAGAMHDKFPDINAASEVTPSGVTAGASTRSTWQYGGGLEYTGLHTLTRTFPFRFGARMQQLPYAGAAESSPKEWSIAMGSGVDIATSAQTPQALIDVTLERAHRSGLAGPVAPDGLKENYWRLNFSLSLFGR